MTLYSVFDRIDAAPEPVAVPDRFSWFAALLPPVYMLRHRLWLALVGFVVALIGLGGVGFVLGSAAAGWLYILGALFFGFEAPAVRRSKLRRTGLAYRAEVIAAAPDLAAVEWLKQQRSAK